MAKTNRPIKVLVHPDIWDTPAVVELREKGNDVQCMEEAHDEYGADVCDVTQFDLVIGPNCWRVVRWMENQIPMAIKAARKVKYNKKKEKK